MRLGILLFMVLAGTPADAGWRHSVPTNCEHLYGKTYGPTPREAAMLEDSVGNFFEIRTPLPGQAAELNDDALKALEREPVQATRATRRKVELDRAEIQRLFDDINSLPQVAETNLCERYKNSERKGFCFGRAVAAHLKALQSGVHNKSIRKVWAVGRLDMDGDEWKYHVTTVVRGKGGKWFALDPSFQGPMPLTEWHERMKTYDPSHTMRLFVTPAKLFGIARAGKYSEAQFSREVFNGFFVDLMAEIRKGNRAKGELRPVQTAAEVREISKKWVAGGAAAAGLSAAGLYELYELAQPKTKN